MKPDAGAMKLDYTEDDMECQDAMKKSVAAMKALIPAYAKCQESVRKHAKSRKKSTKGATPKTLPACHRGIKQATAAIANILDDARKLYGQGGAKSSQDYTKESKGFASLCSYAHSDRNSVKHPYEKCFYHLRKFMIKHKLTYAY